MIKGTELVNINCPVCGTPLVTKYKGEDVFSRTNNQRENITNYKKEEHINTYQQETASKPDYEIAIPEMIKSIESSRFKLEDTNKYLNYLKYFEKSISPNEIGDLKINKIFNKALGRLDPSKLRENLVEIEDILKRIYNSQSREI